MARGFKTGGRKKGSINKLTGTVKEMIFNSIKNEIQSFPQTINSLKPRERIDVVIKLLPFILPKAEEDVERQLERAQQSIFVQHLQRQIENYVEPKEPKRKRSGKSVSKEPSINFESIGKE